MWAQLLHHSASSVEQRTALRARLTDLAHFYCDSTIVSHDFTMHKECFCAINSLQNDDVIITKPDKGCGVFLLNTSDYVDKMNKILDDQSNLKDLVQSPAMTTQPALNCTFRSSCLTKSKLILCQIGYMTQHNHLDCKDLKCMVCRKHTKKALHFTLYCL